jgi:hypothetical protein
MGLPDMKNEKTVHFRSQVSGLRFQIPVYFTP